MEKFKSFKWNNAIFSIICLVLGLVLVIWPEETLSTGSKIIASIILIGSLGSMGYYIFNKNKTDADILYLLISIVAIGISISIFVNPTWIIASFNILVGIALVITGISNITKVFTIKATDGIWWAFGIIPLITLILGFVIMANPMGIANFITRLEGISLIIDAISTWSVIYRINKYIS